MNDINKIIWGTTLIILGLILGLNALNITNINIFFDGWWTLFIIIPSITGLFEEKNSKTDNIIGLTIGIAFLLAAQDIIKLELILKLIIPFILVATGISLVFGKKIKNNVTEKLKDKNTTNFENITAIFSEQNIKKDNQNMKNTNLDSIFGNINLDLKNSILEKETFIKASSIFGNINILIPTDVNLEVKSIPIFGHITSKQNVNKNNKKTIYIDGFCMFGGINIK